MAILRIGSRVPEQDNTTGRFVFNSPPWVQLPTWTEPAVTWCPTCMRAGREAMPDADTEPTRPNTGAATPVPTDTTLRPSAAVGATR